MKRRTTVAFLVFLIACLGGTAAFDPRKPPPTLQKPVTESIHGVSLIDNYRWLEDQDSPGTRAWIGEQQAYTQAYFNSLAGRDEIRRQMAQLMRVDNYELPFLRGELYIFERNPANKNQNQLCLRRGPKGSDEILVDANALSTPGHEVTIRLLDVSRDGRLVAYGIQEGGDDEVTLHLMDIKTRTEKDEHVGKGRIYAVSLLPDNSGLYYSKTLAEGTRVFFHKMGETNDLLIFGDGFGPNTFVAGQVTYDGRWLLIGAQTGWGVKSEVYAMRLGVDSRPKPFITGLDGQFDPNYYRDHIYVVTTWKAPNRRVFDIDLNQPAQAGWKEIIPEQNDNIDSATIVGGKLVLNYLHDVKSRVRICSLEGKFERDVPLPAVGSVAAVGGEPDQTDAFYSFSSFVYPRTNFRYDVSTNQQSVWWQSSVVSHSDEMNVEQLWYESKDKTKVPMFVVHRKDFKRDGTARCLMTGYGGFDVSLTPHFSEMAAYWVNNGGVFALPNLRGGGEFGEKWHKAGMFGNKQNVFDDFEAAAEYLETNGYTRPSRLGILGGSNGGLLMGAALTQRPALFGAVVCEYPLLDMMRYDQFKVAKWWVPEYGSAEKADQFSYLLKYSPYHHVEKGTAYPAVLFVTGDADTRVDPLHARKMTALLQSATASGRPVLLKYDTTSGHSGGTPLEKQIDDNADVMLFLSHELQ
jgi:prolyl oligopeptidase